MANHFTPAFKEAYDKVLKILNTEGEMAAHHAFRDAMLELGHEERVQNLYRIQDKLSKRAAFFNPNQPQKNYLRTKAHRNIILKCRQVGFTTLNCLRALDLALWESNTRTGILCHKLHTVKSIFNDITKFCYDWFLRDWGHLYRPIEKNASSTSLSFKQDGLGRPLESSILVMHDFRGKTLHFLHVSEAARVDADRLIGSVNGVPDNGEVTLESTAHGQGGEFYRLWQLHKARGKTAPYKGFFIPWFDYYPEIMDDWDFEENNTWTTRETELMHLNPTKVTKAHLFWRRFCIEAKCAGDEERFENEYPSNDDDCFLTGTDSVFPSSLLRMQNKNTEDPIFIGHLLPDGPKMKLHDDPRGVIAIWDAPNPSHSYVIGADPSGGVGKDKGAAYVKDQKTNKLVARLWCDLVPADFAQELYKLASFYNKAYICVEANNHGHVVLHVLMKELNYLFLYKRATIDEVTKKPTKKVGFLTNSQNKILITEKFKTATRERKTLVLDKELISEMSTFVQIAGKTGRSVKREASAGSRDDLVMAASLTEEMHSARHVMNEDPHSQYDLGAGGLIFDPETGFAVGGN